MITLHTQRLEEAAELGRSLIAGLADAGLLIVDHELKILVAEGDVYRNLDPDGVVGRSVPEVVPEFAWQILKPRYHEALEGRAQSFDYEAVGNASVYSLRFTPLRDEAAVIGVMVLSEDVTARIEAGRKLADSERLQRSVLEVLDEGVMVLDLARRLTHANPTACAALDLDLASACADPLWWQPLQLRRADDGSALDTAETVLMTGQGIRDVDVEADRSDGTTISLSVNYQPLRDDAGNVSGLVLSFRDVTDRNREHGRLVEIQERLREAHEVARLASWEWQPDSGEVVIFHALAEDDSLPGTRGALEDLLQPMEPEARQKVRDELAAMVRGELEETVRRTCQLRPGGPVWLENRSRAMRDDGGRLLCVRGTSQDVTEQELANQRAAGERDFFQSTLDSLSAHIAVLDQQGEIVMTNRAWVEFAASNDGGPEGLGENYLSACDRAGDDEFAMRTAAGLRAILSGQQTEVSLEYPCHGPTTERWFMLHAERFEGRGDASAVVAHYDVTERHQAEEKVATQAALLDEVDVAVVATDPEGRITHWNRGAERLYGWGYAEVVGGGTDRLISPSETHRTIGAVAELGENGHWEGNFVARRKDDSTFPAYLRGRVMVDGAGRSTGSIGVAVDMTERVASERALRTARNYLRAVTDSMAEGMYTLDTEGRVTYMNEAAEGLLGWSEQELQGRVMHDVSHARRPDGSDFPIEDCPTVRARRHGQTVRVEEDMFVRRDGRELPVAYTAAPFETEEGVEGCVVVFNDISERKAHEESLQREADKLSWIGRIQDALDQDRFVLYAQPIVDLRSGDVVQSELLLRLREPDGRVVGPGEFLQVAEQYGLIGDIDRWVIEQSTELAATGRPVELNLSARSIGDQPVLDHIERCITDSGADPALIVFEITETALVEDQAAAAMFAERLHELGCKLALDDFGTGFGGFTYLKQLPVDYLKIDIEFVRDLATNDASRHVVEAVVALAHGFKLRTVAEGVEDAVALELLREMGVDYAQGYHIARPAPLTSTPPKH